MLAEKMKKDLSICQSLFHPELASFPMLSQIKQQAPSYHFLFFEHEDGDFSSTPAATQSTSSHRYDEDEKAQASPQDELPIMLKALPVSKLQPRY
jgi:hypothetical protein